MVRGRSGTLITVEPGSGSAGGCAGGRLSAWSFYSTMDSAVDIDCRSAGCMMAWGAGRGMLILMVRIAYVTGMSVGIWANSYAVQ